ncbi:hypothetical protein GQ43DRAFT_468757 [Delitschia confertaspora ATCC 74209]|uniref:Mechanosensitive ion channel protein n=1 Tax=Delitschia confertaspora ATCC 74209 TaxID=1513339 RepID=A0A9P4MT32_9PLEO|nr:hypothetical protein GQ43DRAFT_468757 [Delitschia confertaspora ATCC 74209]
MSNSNYQNYNTPDIPLQTVVSHAPSQTATIRDEEKSGMFHRSIHGRRRLRHVDSKGNVRSGDDHSDEKLALNKMGMLYSKILNYSVVTRYLIYVSPLAIALAIPIIVAVVLDQGRVKEGKKRLRIAGVQMYMFFLWIEVVWLSLWACKIVAHFVPRIFEFLVGVVSPGVRKYAQLLRALEIPLSIVFWGIVCQVTFPVLIIRNLIDGRPGWITPMQRVLLAALISSCVYFAERLLIQLISISYHRKQFDGKIKDSKQNIYLLGLLYDASRALFPAYCNEFAEEDYIIQDSLQLRLVSKKGTFSKHNRSGSATPLRILQDVGRFGDKVTSAFGTVAQEITGKKVFDPNSAHSIVLEALERNRSAEALARRIWMSFVVEGKDALFRDDLIEVMGPGRQQEAEECFAALDRDGNGDISLEEMILTVTQFGRERKAIATSMHDVDQAINALDGLLSTIVFIVCVFIFIAFVNQNFVATLTTSATALLSLSFVFAVTCQEVLGSCIFLFVKHPYDIGDRVDINNDSFTVEHISLLYTVFKRVANAKMVQVPNIVLNNQWVENVTRSRAMREQVPVFVAFDTSFDDINTLKLELQNFVRDPANSRDFHPDVEVEVVGIAEMNKLELRVEIRHKSNWSNEALRAARRSKFMCALVLALRKVPIFGPGGGDAALGDAGHPSWSVAISPEEALKARDKFNEEKDAKRLYPTKKAETPDEKDEAEGKSTGVNYLHPETIAINTLNNRSPGADPVRDDTWNNRDDVSTIGRPSMDGRPELDEVRGLLHKESSRGKRKQMLSPTMTEQSRPSMPPLPLPIVPSGQAGPSGYNYAPPPASQVWRSPTSASSVSTLQAQESQYQTMLERETAQERERMQSPPTVGRVAEDDDENSPSPRPEPPRINTQESSNPYVKAPPDLPYKV